MTTLVDMNKKKIVEGVSHNLTAKYKDMWTRNIRSGTMDYPLQRDVYLDLLGVLIMQDLVGKHAHFEVDRLTRGFVKFFTPNPWVEITLETSKTFIIRYHKRKEILFPEMWERISRNSIRLPLRDRQLLITWVEDFFRKHNPDDDHYVIVGWLDGFKKGEKVVA